MNRVFLLITCLFVAACSEKYACSASSPEKFDKFFERYAADKSFSAQRTELPLEVLKWEYGLDDAGNDDSGPTKSKISVQDFEKWPTISEFMAQAPLKSEIKNRNSESATVHVFQPDTDYSMLYHFKILNGCWRMWRFEDESL